MEDIDTFINFCKTLSGYNEQKKENFPLLLYELKCYDVYPELSEVFTIQREDGWKMYVVIGTTHKDIQPSFDIFQIFILSPHKMINI